MSSSLRSKRYGFVTNRGVGALALVVLLGAGGLWLDERISHAAWSETELALLESLHLAALPEIPIDSTNAVSGDPRAARLGQRMFFDTRLSTNGQISCATCHQPERRFTDGLPRSMALGQTKRNAPSIIGAAYSPWLYWDGRRDSLWAQALTPLEDPNEHGGDRAQYARLLATDPDYRRDYEVLFGAISQPMQQAQIDLVFANMGKAIAAYERLLVPGPSRFDAYVDAVLADDQKQQRAIFSSAEVKGLRLFLNQANCIQCHNGPLLTNNTFHNTGVLSAPGMGPDRGRRLGVRQVREDPFNCLGVFSDDANACAELRFVKDSVETLGAFRTPSLRNLQDTEPYMHAGQLPTLADVITHYDNAGVAMIGHNEAKPLGLWPWERHYLEAFLMTLNAPPKSDAQWLQPP